MQEIQNFYVSMQEINGLFLYQRYRYQKRETLFILFCGGREFIGMIQVLAQDGNRIHIGRFLLNPDEAGKGIGTAALKSFCKILFEEMKAEAITLNVAETNDAAQKCYQKCGFTVLKKECRNGKNIWKMVLIQ